MTGADLKIKFDEQWGEFRKFIAANPLTGFWAGVVSGALAGALLRGLF